jgi:hypothetical protein
MANAREYPGKFLITIFLPFFLGIARALPVRGFLVRRDR